MGLSFLAPKQYLPLQQTETSEEQSYTCLFSGKLKLLWSIPIESVNLIMVAQFSAVSNVNNPLIMFFY